MCAIPDGEADLWSKSPRRAAKRHECDVCDQPITKGETYTRVFIVYEGTASSAKVCARCAPDWEQFAQAHHGYHPWPRYFVEAVQSCIADEPESKLVWEPMLERLKARQAAA